MELARSGETVCTLAQIRSCLLEPRVSKEAASPTLLALIREGQIRVVGPLSETLDRLAGRPTRRH